MKATNYPAEMFLETHRHSECGNDPWGRVMEDPHGPLSCLHPSSSTPGLIFCFISFMPWRVTWFPSPCFLTHRQGGPLMAVAAAHTRPPAMGLCHLWVRLDMWLIRGMDWGRNKARRTWFLLSPPVRLWWARRVSIYFFPQFMGSQKGCFVVTVFLFPRDLESFWNV